MGNANKLIITGLLVFAVAAVMLAKSGHLQSSDLPTEPASTGGAAPPPARLPRLLDLGSDKCVPCKMMAPILTELAQTHEESFEVVVIDVRENRAAARKYGIRVIPTQIFYDASGRERFRHEGFMSREAILARWEELGVKLPANPPGVRSNGS